MALTLEDIIAHARTYFAAAEGKRLARERHGFMEEFFERLQQEWEGKK
jgi:hypothetical protein